MEWLDQTFLAGWQVIAAGHGMQPGKDECLGWKVHLCWEVNSLSPISSYSACWSINHSWASGIGNCSNISAPGLLPGLCSGHQTFTYTYVNDALLESGMGLDTVELIMAIEKEFGMEIPNHEAAKLETVGKISEYLQSRLEHDRGQPFDEIEGAALWERVKGIVVEQLGVEPHLVTREAHLVFNLGAD